jgi:hypothetical protein
MDELARVIAARSREFGRVNNWRAAGDDAPAEAFDARSYAGSGLPLVSGKNGVTTKPRM